MSHFAYLTGLVIGIIGLILIDRRLKLAFWFDRWRTVRTLALSVTLFILWDAAGIALRIFAHGTSRFSLPFTIAPEFPVEELFFLFLLCYVTLLLQRGIESRWPRI